MTYSIETTDVFDKWFASKIKDVKNRARIISRFDRIQMGNLGDYRHLDENFYELRFFLAPVLGFISPSGTKPLFFCCVVVINPARPGIFKKQNR